MNNREIVIGVTGGIAAYKACVLVSRLRKEGARVTVVMSGAATEFVTPLTFRTLSGRDVLTGLFNDIGTWDPRHVALADKADILAIVPATANIIGKIASGIADDIVSTVVMSVDCPVLIAPAMNTRMYEKKIVQDNIARLTELGYRFIGPEEGRLASGAAGMGRLASLDAIYQAITEGLAR